MKDKPIEKQVKLLAKQKKYEEIYQEYGPKYFRKYVSRKFKKEDIKKLKNEGKYLAIYERYGNGYIDYIDRYIDDFKSETGRKMTLREKISDRDFIKSYIRIVMISLIGPLIGVSGPMLETDMKKAINARKYVKEISEYEDEIKEYSKQFDINKQTDMELIMKIMRDMHKTIQGYGEPEIDAIGYWGMDVMKEDGIGVCRNMAANMADKLNEINPEYNARVFTLSVEYGKFISANIENNIIEGKRRTNIDGNVKKIYMDEQLKEIVIQQEDSTITYEYENEVVSKKIKRKLNEKEEISYDENGNIIENKKSVTKIEGNKEIEQIFVNGKLETKREKNENFYKSTTYNEDGQIRFETIADKESERTSFYYEEQLDFMTIVEDGYKTRIDYDEQGKEIARWKEETDETNIFLALKKNHEISKEKTIEYHAMVAIDINSDKCTLLIDPTNLGLGVYKDGKIQMFNDMQLDQAVYDRNFILESSFKGTEAIVEYPIEYIKSFIEPTLTLEELEEKYGLEAQNKMLAQIEKEDNQKTFKEELKIDQGITYNFDTNVVTIDNKQREEDKEKEH